MSIVRDALGLKLKISSAHGAESTRSQALDNNTTTASRSELSGDPNSKANFLGPKASQFHFDSMQKKRLKKLVKSP